MHILLQTNVITPLACIKLPCIHPYLKLTLSKVGPSMIRYNNINPTMIIRTSQSQLDGVSLWISVGRGCISITLPAVFPSMLCPNICSHSYCHCNTWIILRWFYWNFLHVPYCWCQKYYHLVYVVEGNHNVISAMHFFVYAHVPILSWIHCLLAHFINVKQNTFSVTAPNACFHSYQSSRHVPLWQKLHYFHHRIHHIWRC